jgi:hypothetical protein
MFSSSVWCQLGKMPNPVSGKIEKDLKGAQATIETLLMLRDKTKGNLSDKEEEMLSSVISTFPPAAQRSRRHKHHRHQTAVPPVAPLPVSPSRLYKRALRKLTPFERFLFENNPQFYQMANIFRRHPDINPAHLGFTHEGWRI